MSKTIQWPVMKALSKALFLLGLAFVLQSCLSMRIAVDLPQKEGGEGTLSLRYLLNEELQNISNYAAPRDDISPLPLPISREDFLNLAAQSPSIRLLSYRFQQKKGFVEAELAFRSEDDLQRLLGKEIRLGEGHFSWHLNAAELELADSSYPQLEGPLSEAEKNALRQFFAGQSVELSVKSPKGESSQKMSMADFVIGEEAINFRLQW